MPVDSSLRPIISSRIRFTSIISRSRLKIIDCIFSRVLVISIGISRSGISSILSVSSIIDIIDIEISLSIRSIIRQSIEIVISK